MPVTPQALPVTSLDAGEARHTSMGFRPARSRAPQRRPPTGHQPSEMPQPRRKCASIRVLAAQAATATGVSLAANIIRV